MSDETSTTTPEAGDNKKGKNTKKIILIGISILLILIIASIFFILPGTGLIGHKEPEKSVEPTTEPGLHALDVTKVTFTTMPEILLNLRNANGRSSFLKATFVVQSPNEEIGKKVERLKPILMDQFQEYLRGLDVEDLAGSAGLQRVRNELLTRANTILEPDRASDILIGSFLIQ